MTVITHIKRKREEVKVEDTLDQQLFTWDGFEDMDGTGRYENVVLKDHVLPYLTVREYEYADVSIDDCLLELHSADGKFKSFRMRIQLDEIVEPARKASKHSGPVFGLYQIVYDDTSDPMTVIVKFNSQDDYEDADSCKLFDQAEPYLKSNCDDMILHDVMHSDAYDSPNIYSFVYQK